jgi:LuxR family maltose regulon positive regulatory protein
VAFLITHLPANVHLVLSSRSDPPLSLGRMRARHEMNEIRTRQLAFSEEEAALLLNEKMRLDLNPRDLSVLLKRTEGWPAAIYLASLSLQQREDKHAYIESFSGSDRYIVDLLAEEVLAGLPEDTKGFLLRTSVLRRLTGPLCDAVADRVGSAELLRELARSNLFVVPSDGQGEWYRYHHLFGELLHYELKGSRPDLVPVLHERASVWSEGERFFDNAIRHAIAATDYERAGMLVARYWLGYLVAGQTATVQRWLDSLSEELTTHDAALALVRAWIYALSGQREESEVFLDIIEGIQYQGPLPDGTASVESGVAIIRSAFGFDGVQAAVEAVRRAAELESKQLSPRTALMRFALGFSLYCSGETSQAHQPLEEALRLTSVEQPILQIVILSALSFVGADEGHLEDAEAFAREAGALVDRFGLRHVPQASAAPIALGKVLAKRGDLAAAQSELERALSVRRKLPGLNPWATLVGLLALAQVLGVRGDRAGAREVLDEARATMEPFGDDTGIFPVLLEREERKLRRHKPREGQLDGELTERELDVLRLHDSELSVSEMAERLYVAPSTVRSQAKSIYRKLGVSSRAGALKEAHARGLI